MRKLAQALLMIGVLALTACAAGKPPFMTDSDWAIKQRLQAELSEYRDLRISVSGGTVYLEGEVPNVPDRNRTVATAEEAPGVKAVFEDLYLTEMGPEDLGAWD